MKKIIYLLLMALFFVGCKSPKQIVKESVILTPAYLSAKMQLTVPNKSGSMSFAGLMKMKEHERVQISFLMPILRSEVVRIEVTPDKVLVVDRMNRQYVTATKDELEQMLSKNLEFSKLEKILKDASLPGAKKEFLGKDLGLPKLDKAKIQLYGFSTDELKMTPTDLGTKYREVPLEDLIKMLTNWL